MSTLRNILAIFGVLLSTLLILSCSKSERRVEIPYTILSSQASKYDCSDGPLVDLTIKIKVDPNVPKVTLEKLCHQIVAEYLDKPTRYGIPQNYAVQAFSDDWAQNQLAYAFISTLPVHVPSSAEQARQQEVGKFAGELIEAGKKIQNR